MKEMELRQHADCSLCGKKIGASGMPMFWRVSVERFGVKMDVVNRQQGLTMMLGGSARLAQVMGADEDMTMPLMEKTVLTVCETCCTKNVCVAELAERSITQKEQDEHE